MALVEHDGPWWGEREAAYLRQLAAVTATAAGAKVPPEDWRIEWNYGAGGEAPAVNLLPAADGLAAFCIRQGLDLVREPAT